MTLIDERPPEAPVDITIDRDGSPIFGDQPGQLGSMRIMDHTGDQTVTWRKGNEAEVAVARAAFDAARDKGYLAYRVDPDDKGKGEVMRRFDPAAGEVILAPAPVGG
jgi:hypothetical protein